MECYLHPQRPVVGTCVSCGKFICEECATEIQGKYHCKKCVGELFNDSKKKIDDLEHNKSNQGPMVFMNAGGGAASSSGSANTAPVRFVCTKSKIAAGILAIVLGGIGVHKFYLGKIGLGIVYLLFCWTFIPEIIGFIEGIILLCMSDESFAIKYGRPIG